MKTISKRETKELYQDFNRAYEAYKALNPEKYTSLEKICYIDMMYDRFIPCVKENQPHYDDDTMLQVAHALWLASIQNGFLDQFCRELK